MKNDEADNEDVPNQIPPKTTPKITIEQALQVLQPLIQQGIFNFPKATCDTMSQAMDKDINAIQNNVQPSITPRPRLVHNWRYGPYQPQQRQQSHGSISEAMHNIYQRSDAQSKTPYMIIPSIHDDRGTYLTTHVNNLMKHTTHGNNNEDDGKDDEKRGEDNNNNNYVNGQPRQNQNNGNGIGNGFGNGFGTGSGNGNGNHDDNANNQNNDNNQRQQPQNNDIAATLAGIADTQSKIVQLMDKKSNESHYKLPKCDIKFYGKKKDGTPCNLAKIVWNVKLWCNTKNISDKHL